MYNKYYHQACILRPHCQQLMLPHPFQLSSIYFVYLLTLLFLAVQQQMLRNNHRIQSFCPAQLQPPSTCMSSPDAKCLIQFVTSESTTCILHSPRLQTVLYTTYYIFSVILISIPAYQLICLVATNTDQ